MAIGTMHNMGVNAFNPQNQPIQNQDGIVAGQNIANVGGVGGPLPDVAGFAEVQRQGAQNMPQVGVNELRGAVQPQAPEGRGAKIARWFNEGNIRLKGNGGLPPITTIEHPKLGTVRYGAQELKAFINTLPRLDRQAARDNLAAHVSARIDNGIAAYENALSDNPVPPTMQQAADLMLFLDAKAHATGNGFAEGAFSIEDQDNKLYQYLDSCPEKYLRSSSHMKESQGDQVQGHTNVHRGIDIPKGPNGLPNGKATILFANIPAHGDTPARIYMKPEPAGCRLSTLSAAKLEAGSSAVPQRPARFSDIGQAIKHGCGFLGSVTGNSSATLGADGVRKERISSDVKKAYQEVITTVAQYTPEGANANREIGARDAVLGILKDYKLSSTSGGLSEMLTHLKDAKYLVNNDEQTVRGVTDVLEQAVEVFAQKVATKIKDASYLDSRICNEVMFSTADLQEDNHGDAAPAMTAAERAVALVTATQATDVDKAQYTYSNAKTSVEMLFARHHIEGDAKANLLAILERNPAGGAMKANQMIDNIKSMMAVVSAELPHGLSRNEITTNCAMRIKGLCQYDTRRADDATNAQVFRAHMMSMVPQNGWNPAQLAICEAAKPAYAMIIHHHAEPVKAGFDGLLATRLPQSGTPEYEDDVSAVNEALSTLFKAVEVSLEGTLDGADAIGEISNMVCNFALADLSREQKQDLYAKFSNPDCHKLMAYMDSIGVKFRLGGHGDVPFSKLVGMESQRGFIIRSMVDGLERDLGIAQDQRLETNSHVVVEDSMKAALNSQTREIFEQAQTVQNPDGSQHIHVVHSRDTQTDLAMVMVDGKRAVPFAEALEKAEYILPEVYQLDNAREIHLTIQKPEGKVVVSTPEDVFNAFAFEAEDGTKYLDFDLCRTVTCLSCQTTLSESEKYIHGGDLPDSIDMIVDIAGNRSRSFVFNPAEESLSITSTEARNFMVHNGEMLELDQESASSLEMKMHLNKADDGHYDATLQDYYVSLDWGLEDESPFL